MSVVARNKFNFTLVLDNVFDVTEEMEDRLFNSGCDDCTIILRSGRVCLDFVRTADSFLDAVVSAIENIGNARIGATVERVDESDLVSQSEISRRLGCSRQNVHQLMHNEDSHFPRPIANITEGQTQWRWHEVSETMCGNGKLESRVAEDAKAVAVINCVLEVQHFERVAKELLHAVQVGINDVVLRSGQTLRLAESIEFGWPNSPGTTAKCPDYNQGSWEPFKVSEGP